MWTVVIFTFQQILIGAARVTYGDKINADRFVTEKPNRDRLEHRGIDGKIILKLIPM
jgi:hypothetical protein